MSYAKIILLLLIPMALVMGYALSSLEIGSGDVVLEKADLSGVKRMFPMLFVESDNEPSSSVIIRSDSVATSPIDSSSLITYIDSISPIVPGTPVSPTLNFPDTAIPPEEEPIKEIKVHKPDLTKFRIMIFGDSMLEWLAKRLCDYTLENGYDLSSIIWYSSSTKLWATTDTLQYFLNRIKPDYVILCLGSNELFVRDLAKREKYIATIVERIGDRPFLWIGPPNWKKDTGINDLIRKGVGEGRFFDSRDLELDRAEDNMHPSRSAAALWMDTIANWLNSSAARNPLKMDRPTQTRRRVYHQYMLRPPR
ncbi:MAG: SGNH/GDSL hydrolase family protein [Bacteroidales bacterium]|nr:SGNH/GDSL hydrolase family protein [Bacteroidales bacterium]